MENLKELGSACQRLRELLGASQIDIANETGYSKETISAFETGRNNNARVLLWYIRHGFRVDLNGSYYFGDAPRPVKSVNLMDANDLEYIKLKQAVEASRCGGLNNG